MKTLIMAGGQGTRFWPLSRKSEPKQFLRLSGRGTMLQETVGRLSPLLSAEDIFVVASPEYVPLIRRQLPELPANQIIVEPHPRNTAPCIALAMSRMHRLFPDETVAVLAADHSILDVAEFQQVLSAARELAREGWLVTFGIRPSGPSTSFGYIKQGETLGRRLGLEGFRVERFTEKPDHGRAAAFLESGEYLWNSGMFVWSMSRILAELQEHMPDLLQAVREMELHPSRAAEIFSNVERTSIDYGVMERTSRAAVLPCNLGWNDVGLWDALAEIRSPDSDGVIFDGLLENVGSRDCIVVTTGNKLTALVGVKDLVVVETPDAILVCRRGRTEEVRKVVESLRQRNLDRFL